MNTDATLHQTDLRNEAENATENVAERYLNLQSTSEIVEWIAGAKSIFEQNYPYTITVADRNRKKGAGIRRFGFSQAAHNSAMTNQSFLPSYVIQSDFDRKMDCYNYIQQILVHVEQFRRDLADALLYAGNDAYNDSLAYYNSLKEADKQGYTNAEQEYNRLKVFFNKSKSASDQPTKAQLERDIHGLLHGSKEGKIAIENEKAPHLTPDKRVVIDHTHTTEH
jgi:hypothetical protein